MPALASAQLMQERVARYGFDWDNVDGVLDKVAEEASELTHASNDAEKTAELGDLLFAVVNVARWQGIYAEDALREANLRFKRRYLVMERLARERDVEFVALSMAEKETLWQEAKRIVSEGALT